MSDSYKVYASKDYVDNKITGGGSEIPKPLTYDYMPEGYPTKKVSIVTLLEEQDLQFNESEGVYFSDLPKIIDFQEGETYKIVFDGTEYNCVCAIDESVGLYIGNIGIFYGTESENNEPFLATKNLLGTIMTGAIHRVSIEGPSIDYTLIDRKFLPIASEETSGITTLKITSNDVYKKYISTPTVEMGSNTFLRNYLNQNSKKVTIGFHKDNKTIGFSLDRSTAGGNVDLILAYAYKQTIVGYHVGDTGAKKTFELEKDGLTIASSTEGSTKRFKITVDDSGALTATEVTE